MESTLGSSPNRADKSTAEVIATLTGDLTAAEANCLRQMQEPPAPDESGHRGSQPLARASLRFGSGTHALRRGRIPALFSPHRAVYGSACPWPGAYRLPSSDLATGSPGTEPRTSGPRKASHSQAASAAKKTARLLTLDTRIKPCTATVNLLVITYKRLQHR